MLTRSFNSDVWHFYFCSPCAVLSLGRRLCFHSSWRFNLFYCPYRGWWRSLRCRFSFNPNLNCNRGAWLFMGDWLELSPGFNMMPPTWRSDIRRVFDPVIVHFAGALKPWHGPRFIIDHPARAAMERYFPTSRWKGFLTQYFSLRDALAPAKQPPQPDFHFGMPFPSRPIFLDYLRNTPFADVEAGLTAPHLDLLPLR